MTVAGVSGGVDMMDIVEDKNHETLTLAHLGFALAAFLELVESVYHGEDLHGTDGIEHVRIVTRCGAEPTVLVLTGEHKVYSLLARKGCRVAEQMQGNEAPVDSVQAQVLSEPVVVLILAGVQALDILDMFRGSQLQFIGEFVQLRCHAEMGQV